MPAGQLAFCDEAHAVCAAAPAPADVAEAEKVKGAQALHTTSDVFVPSAAKYVPAGQEVLHGEQPPLLFSGLSQYALFTFEVGGQAPLPSTGASAASTQPASAP